MKYKEMIVWSAGEKGKTKKIEFVFGLVLFVAWLVLCVMFFTTNMNDDKTVKMTLLEHLGYGLGLSFVTSLFGLMGYATASLSLKAIKRNKEIAVQLYDFDDFIKMGKVPDGKKVVFSDTSGFVLCNEEDESEYNDWQGLSKKDLYFFKFEEYFDKYKGEKQEIFI